ncbi:Ig-like domain-containing protein, partial [Acinetobacter sp. CFCC 10889]|uniref:Ig-like domain-containing protein n=1 Tax=Acinetobacter sp. CFCC 10889 TaxID=1775557 RepID=UPI0013A69CC3
DGGVTWSTTKPIAQEGENSISVRQTDKAGNVSNPTEIKFTLDTLVPTASLVIDSVTADNIVNAAEAGTIVTLTGQVTGEFTEGDTVTLTINNQPYTAAVQADGSWSVDVAGSDLLAGGGKSIAGSVVVHDVAGNPATVTADKVYSIDTTAPTATLSIDAVTADNVVNAAEAGTTVTLTGNVTGEFTEGDTVTLTINDQPYTAAVQADGSWSVDVAGSDLLADGDKSIAGSVVVHDVAGNGVIILIRKDYNVDE